MIRLESICSHMHWLMRYKYICITFHRDLDDILGNIYVYETSMADEHIGVSDFKALLGSAQQ